MMGGSGVGRILTRILPGREEDSAGAAPDGTASDGADGLRQRIDELHDQAPGMRDTEQAPVALELMREAWRLCAGLPHPITNDADLWRLARTTDRLAVEYVRNRDREAGVAVARDLVRAARSATDAVGDWRRRQALSSGLQWLACHFKSAEDTDELATARDAVRERRYFYQETPELDRPSYARALSRLAEVLAERGS